MKVYVISLELNRDINAVLIIAQNFSAAVPGIKELVFVLARLTLQHP